MQEVEKKVIWLDNKTYKLILEQLQHYNKVCIETRGEDAICVKWWDK